MSYFYISLASSLLAVIGYVPEIVNLSSSIIYKKPYNEFNSTIIWIIWISSSFLGITYSYFIQDYYVMTSYSLTALLNITVCSLRYYHFLLSKNDNNNNKNKEIMYEVNNPLNEQTIYRMTENKDIENQNQNQNQNDSF